MLPVSISSLLTPTRGAIPRNGMNYQSLKYALLNTPIEVGRHVERVRKFLAPQPADRVLDIGCGRGYVLQNVQRLAPAAIGIDLNQNAIANAVTRGTRMMDAERLSFGDGSFDKIYSFHVVEHIPDLAAAFREIDRVLTPGGSVLLVYPAEPIRGLYVIPTAMLLFGNPLKARNIHIRALTPRSIGSFLTGTRLRIVRSELQFLLTPQFITVLHKEAAS